MPIIHNYFPAIRDRAISDDADPAIILPKLVAAVRKYDKLHYLKGLKKFITMQDVDQWHSCYDSNNDSITLQAKFFKKSFADMLRVLMHEVGHRGQYKDPQTFETFKKLGLGHVKHFLEMANAVHRRDFRRKGIENPVDEAFAESYSRFCLSVDMPSEVEEFWRKRIQ